jgi:hypothetical protein
VLKTVSVIGLAATLLIPSASAFAVSGESPSYGTEVTALTSGRNP